jgi:hypothetical protein
LRGSEGNGRKRWSRKEVAKKLEEVEEESQCAHSQRQKAEELEVPRSTLQYWLSRKSTIDADPEVIAFFESPAGVVFLHRLVLAVEFVITMLGGGGIRLVCTFLELCGLDQFVAASYGAQQKVTVAMEKSVVEFGAEERARLAKDMPSRQITVCEDETFHPQICLVSIEPVSNFILLEQYVDNRQAQTWINATEQATADLRVEIVQSTSDEGKGLLCHVEEHLGAHHSPDVFHVQHELVKGISGALASKVRKAEGAASEVKRKVNRLQKALEEGTGCSQKRNKQLAQAQEQGESTQQVLEAALVQRERAQQAIQGIGTAYHPYDLETGAARSSEEVSMSLNEHFTEIETVAEEAQLSENALQRIAKAKRVVVKMVATIAFFWHTVKAKVEALDLAPQVERAVYDHLIPGIYLHLVSKKVEDAKQRYALQNHSEKLLAPLRTKDGPLRGLAPEELILIEAVAQQCAQLFQRSSSCVEGRNGQLALHHHRLHRIGNRKLTALTTTHNYFVRRADSTTAAERFFAAKPRDLFEWVLDRVDLPGRPAQKRTLPQETRYLVTGTAC